jgi:hypothetical protein
MSNKTPTNPKGAGRPESGKKTYPVRCHPKVIKDVRKYAKEQSEQYLNKKQDEKPIQ